MTLLYKTTIELHSLSDTAHLADRLAERISPGSVVGLEGDLGAGKTTFTQYLAQAMGITAPVTSPTFTIMRIYDEVNPPLYHIDAYRLESVDADYELEEYIHGEGVCVIEWYTNIEVFLPEELLMITFVWTGEESRLCTIEGSGRYEALAREIAT